MRHGIPLIAALTLIATTLCPSTARADECSGSGAGGVDFIDVGVLCQQPGGFDPAAPLAQADDASADPFVRYRWASVCTLDPNQPPVDLDCVAALSCAEPEFRRWQLWGQLANESWQVLRTQCFGGTPPEFTPPEVTPAMVLTALRRVGLPELTTHVQPAGRTLVNFDTIFYTDPEPVALQLTILGQGVDVAAESSSYRWVFGDGTVITTESPGGPYPSKEIVHRYTDADVTVAARVEAAYSARFRVSGGDWQQIAETVTTVGPASELRIVEGTPLLASTG